MRCARTGLSADEFGRRRYEVVARPRRGEARLSAPEQNFQWFGSGGALLDAMEQAIAGAQRSVRLETYIFAPDATGRRFRAALAAAAERGCAVELLVDALGSRAVTEDFFAPLVTAGGHVRRFNAKRLDRFTLRDHRKLLAVDGASAFVGGCNLADEYAGDGVNHGWRDGGVGLRGAVVAVLEAEFARQWERATSAVWRLVPGGYALPVPGDARTSVLAMKPGFGASALRTALRGDLARAEDIAITAAYFLPSHRLLRRLRQARRRGARVRLLLPSRSDVPLMALATQSLYRTLLASGVEVFEYEPQVLHAKSLVLDGVVYTGSSNLDPRSLRLNFELMLRIEDAALAAQAAAQFEQDLSRSRRVTAVTSWRRWSWWRRLGQSAAWLLLARLDPWLAREQLRGL
jgi:cardiolipin synthase A/B